MIGNSVIRIEIERHISLPFNRTGVRKKIYENGKCVKIFAADIDSPREY